MKMAHNITWLAAAILAMYMAAGCDRSQPSARTAGQEVDWPAHRAGEKMDRAAADIGQKAARAGDGLDDAAITAKVNTALTGEPGLQALQIHVDTARGVVTLTGAVDTPQSLDRATRVAQAVQGVKSVDNRLNVKVRA